MGIKLKLVSIGDAIGVVLPEDVVSKLNVKKDGALYLSETSDGFLMSRYDEGFTRQVDAGDNVMRKNRDVLSDLAK